MNTDIKELYNSENSVLKYTTAVDNIGLWKSEKKIIEEYIDKNSNIIDLGCGAGRTTINLYREGYKNIIGIDFSYKLIDFAKKYCNENQLQIDFHCCDVTNLNYEDNFFDAAIFSYNGLMCIPKECNRIKALNEIKRVLKSNSVFIFTAHNREANDHLRKLWCQKKLDWDNGIREENTYDFGDLWTINSNGTAFVHFSTREEIIKLLVDCGYEVLKIIDRDSHFEETPQTLEFSGNTDFYICKSI